MAKKLILKRYRSFGFRCLFCSKIYYNQTVWGSYRLYTLHAFFMNLCSPGNYWSSDQWIPQLVPPEPQHSAEQTRSHSRCKPHSALWLQPWSSWSSNGHLPAGWKWLSKSVSQPQEGRSLWSLPWHCRDSCFLYQSHHSQWCTGMHICNCLLYTRSLSKSLIIHNAKNIGRFSICRN